MLRVLGIVHVGGRPGDGERDAVAGGVHPHAALAARLEPQVEGAAPDDGAKRPSAAGLARLPPRRPPFTDGFADGRQFRALVGVESGKAFAIVKGRLQILPIAAEVIVAYPLVCVA